MMTYSEIVIAIISAFAMGLVSALSLGVILRVVRSFSVE